ncbi:lysozyme family protein [Bacillus sp. 165]|uniref:bifunctional lytic transglycosylase/C40 family peptidase n=1 Tax=Bacillus sp. 165 TaxID=1529117 RepID=UPI001AD97639|nr:lysozyme family protein [Bacillus sp. 165]MBO9128972.1 lysozyme family protein [Bacillus sp. 165]
MYAKALLASKYWSGIFTTCMLMGVLLFLLFFGAVPEKTNEFMIAPEVERWEPVVREAVKEEGLDEQYIPVLLAIIMQESGGTAADVMQSSESAGLLPGAIVNPTASIKQGVIHWKNMLQIGEKLGITDLPTIIQSYNFGPGWLYFIKDHGGMGTEVFKKQFSSIQTKVTSCGWRSPYCYGDYTYSEKVMRYFNRLQGEISTNVLYQQVMTEAIKYKGWPYSWGGASPTTSFDCSGLLQWAFASAGVTLPRTAQEQYKYTIRIQKQDLQPGDLVFFTGTSDHAFISHVGIYVGNEMMYNSNSKGVGYSDLTKPGWREKIYGYGRIPTGGTK